MEIASIPFKELRLYDDYRFQNHNIYLKSSLIQIWAKRKAPQRFLSAGPFVDYYLTLT